MVVALIVLTALIFLMAGNTGGFLTGKVTVRSYFENSAGLKVGAPVNLEGVTVGTVKNIRIVPARKLTPVEVTMKVGKNYAEAVRDDSKTSLVTVGVLGDTVVDIDSKRATGGPLKDNSELQTTESPNLSDVIKSSQGTIEQLNTILAKVDSLVDALNSGKGSIGQLINDPALYNKALSSVNQIQQLIDQISSGKGSIGKLVTDDTLYNRANTTVGKLEKITTDLDSGKGSIGKLLKDDTLYTNLNQTVASANQLLADVNAGKGGLGVIAKDPKFAEHLNDTLTRLDNVLVRIDNGQGTIGQLVNNPSIYNNLDQMLTESRGLISGIRENPKKYLTFHVKVF